MSRRQFHFRPKAIVHKTLETDCARYSAGGTANSLKETRPAHLSGQAPSTARFQTYIHK
jgi:hypothetical protein